MSTAKKKLLKMLEYMLQKSQQKDLFKQRWRQQAI